MNDGPELGLGEGGVVHELDRPDHPPRPFRDLEVDVDRLGHGIADDQGLADPRLGVAELPIGAGDGQERRPRLVDQAPRSLVGGLGEDLGDRLVRQGRVALDIEAADHVAGAFRDREHVERSVFGLALRRLDTGFEEALLVKALQDQGLGLAEIGVLREHPGPAFPDGFPGSRREAVPLEHEPFREFPAGSAGGRPSSSRPRRR